MQKATTLLEEILKINATSKDSTSTTQEQIQETEKQMNEIFEYGQKSIFKSNSKEFSNKTVEE